MAELEADRRHTDMPTTMGSHGSSIPVRSVGSFSIPAIITGMWQVAGGCGKNDQKKAAEEMKRYAFAGLGVFDMDDICEFCCPLGPGSSDCVSSRCIPVFCSKI